VVAVPLVTLKYVFVLLRADFNGEGGTFALMALAQSVAQRSKHVILLLGISGAAFLYGDAAITPALSVISAVEGLKVITPAFERAVVPLSLAILIGLFAMQRRGTARVVKMEKLSDTFTSDLPYGDAQRRARPLAVP
jgi:KUP system potassium uptake protein